MGSPTLPPPERGRSVNVRESGRSRVGVLDRARFNRTPEKTERAQGLRQAATNVENRLWAKLRNHQLAGFGFRRQHPVGRYILDFYCPKLKLAIELDGGQHNSPAHQVRDSRRDAWLKLKGVTILRFWNSDVIENFSGTLEHINSTAAKLGDVKMTPTRRWRADLPLSGGGKGGLSRCADLPVSGKGKKPEQAGGPA